MDSSSQSLAVRFSALLLRLRRSFFKMTMREKVLALLFAFALMFVWFTWQWDRHSALSQQQAAARRTELMQQNRLDIEAGLRRVFEEQKATIDLSALPSKDEVSGQIDALVRLSGFASFDLSQARTEQGTDMVFHTFQLVVQKAPYASIKSFTKTVKAELPFLSLERVIIQAQARDDQFLDARYVFKSIEYTK